MTERFASHIRNGPHFSHPKLEATTRVQQRKTRKESLFSPFSGKPIHSHILTTHLKRYVVTVAFFLLCFFLSGSSLPNRLNVAQESWWVAQALGNLQLLPKLIWWRIKSPRWLHMAGRRRYHASASIATFVTPLRPSLTENIIVLQAGSNTAPVGTLHDVTPYAHFVRKAEHSHVFGIARGYGYHKHAEQQRRCHDTWTWWKHARSPPTASSPRPRQT